jgi:hypothetical protein
MAWGSGCHRKLTGSAQELSKNGDDLTYAPQGTLRILESVLGRGVNSGQVFSEQGLPFARWVSDRACVLEEG